MKSIFRIAIIFLGLNGLAFAQEASVDVKLKPAGSFKGKSNEVKGFATLNGNTVEAKNIIVGLKNIETGVKLRDEHTRKHLEVEKFPEAILISATGKDGKGEGIIKIRGIEKPISGTYSIEGDKLKAEFPVKFSEFGITGIKYMGIGVDDNGKINVTVPLQKAASAPTPAKSAPTPTKVAPSKK